MFKIEITLFLSFFLSILFALYSVQDRFTYSRISFFCSLLSYYGHSFGNIKRIITYFQHRFLDQFTDRYLERVIIK